jgi:transcriptional regulator NrdR family protein
MKCPKCGVLDSKVTDSRAYNKRTKQPWSHDGIRRRRECSNGHRYTTYETIVPVSLVHQKKLEEAFIAKFGNGYD